MKRRDFLKQGAVTAGLIGSLTVDSVLLADEVAPAKMPDETSAAASEIRDAESRLGGRHNFLQPKQPTPARSYSISPMALAERVRRRIVPQRGFCSLRPGDQVSESLISGNGSMRIELMGEPYAEQILFHQERLLMPWKEPLEAPDVADIFPRVRQLVLQGKDREAMMLALQHMNDGPIKEDTEPHVTIPAFLMHLEFPESKSARDYLRTLDFETGEATVYWSDEQGDWARRTLVSRPDNVVVQWLTAPEGKSFSVRISLEKSDPWTMVSGMDWGSHLGINAAAPDRAAFAPSPSTPKPAKGVEANLVHQDLNEQNLVFQCILDPTVNNSGYAAVVRLVRNGGSAHVDGGTVVVESVSSAMLLTRIEYFPDFNDEKVYALRDAVEGIAPEYSELLNRNKEVQGEMFRRVTVDFGGAEQCGMAVEELLSDQRSRPDYSPALLEKVFEMGRHWFVLHSGKYPAIVAEVNSTMDLTTAGAVQGNLREGMDAYFQLMESLAPDCLTNAKNVFGCRGACYPLFPDKGVGANFYYTSSSGIGIWSYWISAGGWRLRPLWDQYLVTGGVEFLRDRVVPAYKNLALFYEDFLKATDENGNFMFVPSISPENVPRNTDSSGPALINATMDIAVCREVLTNLMEASEILGTDAENLPKWQAMLAKMPPYMIEVDGTLKEWAWPTLEEHYNHRHVSHLYGVWPGDEIDPDRTPQLARAAEIANRRRTFDVLATAVAGETLAAYARCHRALVGARLKDNVMVDIHLRQMLEQGYVSTGLRCSREPYGTPVPDAQCGIPALVMEMLLYSRAGVIEVLPALPSSLVKGSIGGISARTFARIDSLEWNMESRFVDMTVTSFRKQDLTLIARYGISEIKATAGVVLEPPERGGTSCELRLPEGNPISLRLKLGRQKPLDWISRVDQA